MGVKMEVEREKRNHWSWQGGSLKLPKNANRVPAYALS